MAKKAAEAKARVRAKHPAGKLAPRHETGKVEAERPMAAETDNTDYDPELDEPEEVDPRPAPSIRVRALKDGYYDDKRRRAGDVFTIRPPYQGDVENDGKVVHRTIDEFSKKWMKKVARSTPERITTGKQVLRRQHDAEMQRRMSGAPPDNPTGAEKVLE